MNPSDEWTYMMVVDDWVLLSRDHPDYPIQQAFCEAACLSREEDPDKLYKLAMADFTSHAGPDLKRDRIFPPIRIRKAFRKWSIIQAGNNAKVNNDPYMQGLEAAENVGPEARDKFLVDNPRGPCKD
jgi:hypothetical protein